MKRIDIPLIAVAWALCLVTSATACTAKPAARPSAPNAADSKPQSQNDSAFNVIGKWLVNDNGNPIEIKSLSETVMLEVVSNDIYINARIAKADNNTYNFYLDSNTNDSGTDAVGPQSAKLNWKELSRSVPIATLSLTDNENAELKWLGLYDNSKKKYEITTSYLNDGKAGTTKHINKFPDKWLDKSSASYDIAGSWTNVDPDISFIEINIERPDKTTSLEVESNQIYVNAKIKKNFKKPNVYNFYFDSTGDLGSGGMRTDWTKYSHVLPIATIRQTSANTAELEWLGFYSTKTHKYDFAASQLNNETENAIIKLKRQTTTDNQ